MAFQLKAFTKTCKRKAISRSKLYFFDKGIRALKEEGNIRNFAVISRDRHERKMQDDITIFPWKLFLEKLWNGEIV